MPSRYPHKLALSLKAELERLKNGDTNERQRHNKALVAINKAAQHPLHGDYKKDLPENYKAADVLQQYRLFFRIVPAAESGESADVVYFVWINDEDAIHRSGAGDDCYAIFRKMLVAGQIEAYAPTAAAASGNFQQHDPWGVDVVYASFKRKLPAEQHASTHLTLSKVTANSYRIEYVTVSTEDAGLASALLDELCKSAQQSRIELVYELCNSVGNNGKTRHLLEKFDFSFTDQIDDTEIWVRAV